MTQDQDNQQKCMDVVEPLLVDFHEAWHTAQKLYRDEYAVAIRAEHDDALAAQCVRRHMLLEVIRRLDGRAGCTILNIQGFRILNYFDKAVLRFKKVNEDGKHSAYQTKQQKEFDDQEPLPGIPEAAVRLTCGYQLDIAGENIDRVVIARPMGRAIAWVAQIVVLDQQAAWSDITPQRLPGTEALQFRRRGRAS